MREHVILVNDNDQEVGFGEKMQTHRDGKLHRAFSIFVFDSNGRLLLQKRSATKYHSANLWSNTCCGHPQPAEPTLAAAHRRLQQELGLDCELHEQFTFRYRTVLGNQLVENEYDHVLVGHCNTEPLPNVTEVQDWRWVWPGELKKDLQEQPAQYTYWLRIAIDRWQHLNTNAHGRRVSSLTTGPVIENFRR